MNDQKKTEQVQQTPPAGRWITAVIILLVIGTFSILAALVIGAFVSTDSTFENGNVALINIRGFITIDAPTELLGPELSSSTEIVELIEKANENDDIKAILLDINSGGGSPVASYEVMQAIKESNKTVVAWMREVGASGAYWIASASDYIVANPMTITGSIGVYGSYLDFSGFIERYNVSYERLVSGEYKDLGTPFKELTKEERAILQDSLDQIREEFIRSVAENRNLSDEEMDRTANGLFYLGKDAKALNLIDKLGGKDDAIAYIEDKHEIEADIVEYKKQKTFMDLLEGVVSGQSFNLGLGLGRGMYSDSVSIKT